MIIQEAVVPENVAVGTDVTAVVAVDPDDGAAGRMAYGGEASGLFAVSHTMGHHYMEDSDSSHGASLESGEPIFLKAQGPCCLAYL
jgi:hypothetical protein